MIRRLAHHRPLDQLDVLADRCAHAVNASGQVGGLSRRQVRVTGQVTLQAGYGLLDVGASSAGHGPDGISGTGLTLSSIQHSQLVYSEAIPAPKIGPQMTPATTATVLDAYLRVSTAGQAKSGLGEAAQRDEIERAAQANGWTIAEWHVDAGRSGGGSIDKRPGLTAARERIAAGQTGGLIVSKIDRLGRSLDAGRLFEDARRNDWRLIALDLGADSATTSGEMLAGMLLVIARFEFSRISERQVAKFEQLRKQGRARGHVAVAVVIADQIINARSRGLSLAAIAERLEDEGIATAQGGARWYPSSVRSAILTRQAELDAQAA